MKKLRGPLTGKAKRNNDMTYDVLSGVTLEDAAEAYGFNSKQAAHKAFRLTAVNFFAPSYRKGIIEKGYNIGYLRKLWKETQL